MAPVPPAPSESTPNPFEVAAQAAEAELTAARAAAEAAAVATADAVRTTEAAQAAVTAATEAVTRAAAEVEATAAAAVAAKDALANARDLNERYPSEFTVQQLAEAEARSTAADTATTNAAAAQIAPAAAAEVRARDALDKAAEAEAATRQAESECLVTQQTAETTAVQARMQADHAAASANAGPPPQPPEPAPLVEVEGQGDGIRRLAGSEEPPPPVIQEPPPPPVLETIPEPTTVRPPPPRVFDTPLEMPTTTPPPVLETIPEPTTVRPPPPQVTEPVIPPTVLEAIPEPTTVRPPPPRLMDPVVPPPAPPAIAAYTGTETGIYVRDGTTINTDTADRRGSWRIDGPNGHVQTGNSIDYDVSVQANQRRRNPDGSLNHTFEPKDAILLDFSHQTQNGREVDFTPSNPNRTQVNVSVAPGHHLRVLASDVARSGDQGFTLNVTDPSTGRPGGALAIVVRPEDRVVIEQNRTWEGHAGSFTSVTFPDGRRLFVPSETQLVVETLRSGTVRHGEVTQQTPEQYIAANTGVAGAVNNFPAQNHLYVISQSPGTEPNKVISNAIPAADMAATLPPNRLFVTEEGTPPHKVVIAGIRNGDTFTVTNAYTVGEDGALTALPADQTRFRPGATMPVTAGAINPAELTAPPPALIATVSAGSVTTGAAGPAGNQTGAAGNGVDPVPPPAPRPLVATTTTGPGGTSQVTTGPRPATDSGLGTP